MIPFGRYTFIRTLYNSSINAQVYAAEQFDASLVKTVYDPIANNE